MVSYKRLNKRTFLKVLGAASCPLEAAPAGGLTNWAGNFAFSVPEAREARSAAEVRSFVAAQARLRALGTRHCFNRIADSEHSLLSQAGAADTVVVAKDGKTAHVNAGITYGRLAPLLDRQGYALHNLASLPHISVAGSISTGTHGSGERNGNLSTAVSELEMVTANGEWMRLSRKRDGETFWGSVVGLGALGVITSVSLDVQPKFTVRQYVYEDLPIAQMKDAFDAIQASAYSVSLFTDYQKGLIGEVWLKARENDPAWNGPAEFHGARRASRNLHPIAALSAENCTEQLGAPGPWHERLPHFRMGFMPSAGKELQAEYFVPRKHAVEAILAVEKLKSRIAPHLMISEIRTIAEDRLWMSPCYGRASVAIHFTWKQDTEAVMKLLPSIERELGPFEPRPHWGKLFTFNAAHLRKVYPKLDDFTALMKRMDPRGKFRNRFLSHLF